jgi:predicted RNA binding protein YcfA (HicA-like mRNA interferase family)
VKSPRNIDGAELADHLIRHWGYRKTHQTGSHIHLRTDVPTGQTTIVPAHRPLKTGTLNGILNHVARHKQVTRAEIRRNI